MDAVRVAVIGGGIQGVGVALELSLRGASVTLFEKASSCLTQTSSQHEGKIHLGFVYAKDLTLATARLMVQGALCFEPMLRHWLERSVADGLLSSPFHYLVHRDSVVADDDLWAYYRTVSDLVACDLSRPGASYFGQRTVAPVRKVPAGELNGLVDAGRVRSVFATPELAIDPEPIASLLRARVADDPRIRVHASTTVTGVERHADAVTVTAHGPEGVRAACYDHAVNASWASLLAIDASAGVSPPGPWSYRVKYFLRIRRAPALSGAPSATIVLGGFGDVVSYPCGDLFLSWYPVGRRGLSTDPMPPPWPLPLGEPAASEVRAGIHGAMCQIMPRLSEVSREAVAASEVMGGIIYALGDTDIGDPASHLHQRHDVGLRSFGHYHSVNTGKYTLAPLFSRLTADRIMEGIR
jgi:glycine/D-amino acid oxidase-like deaminating enzyme